MFALGVILYIMLFGVPPFTEATRENTYYRLFYRNNTKTSFFFRLHPATRDAYSKGELDPEMSEILLALLDESPDMRPKSIEEIR